MRYLVETEDTLVLNNIQLNNKCTITPAADVVAVAEFETETTNGATMIYTCPLCGWRTGSVGVVNYCSNCGAKNGGTK